jgi:hypothetical protein
MSAGSRASRWPSAPAGEYGPWRRQTSPNWGLWRVHAKSAIALVIPRRSRSDLDRSLRAASRSRSSAPRICSGASGGCGHARRASTRAGLRSNEGGRPGFSSTRARTRAATALDARRSTSVTACRSTTASIRTWYSACGGTRCSQYAITAAISNGGGAATSPSNHSGQTRCRARCRRAPAVHGGHTLARRRGAVVMTDVVQTIAPWPSPRVPVASRKVASTNHR